jgi:hypothetical protein
MTNYTVTVTALDEVENEWSADYAVTVMYDGRKDTWHEQGHDPELDLELLGTACESLEAERFENGAVLDDLMDKAWDAAIKHYWDNYSYGEDAG